MIYNSLRLVNLLSEFNWVEYSGHYYFYGAENVTWTDAKVLKTKIFLFYFFSFF